MIEIDGPRALELLQAAVDEKGADYVYPTGEYETCSYARDDSPSCLVGHAVHCAGVTIDALHCMDVDTIEDDEGNQLDASSEIQNIPTERYGFRLMPGAVRAFQEAQQKQDSGIPWGEALLYAREAVESRTR